MEGRVRRGGSEVVADGENPAFGHAAEVFGDVADLAVFPCGKTAGKVVGAHVVVVKYLDGCTHLEAEVETGGFLVEERVFGGAVDHEAFVAEFRVEHKCQVGTGLYVPADIVGDVETEHGQNRNREVVAAALDRKSTRLNSSHPE